MAGVLDILLERDGHDQPWGFRLQGGQDVGMPLSVQRALVGTPAEGVLKRGDIILRINGVDVKGLTHQQAADLFTNTGNQIMIQIKRAISAQCYSASSSTVIAPPQPVPVTSVLPLSSSSFSSSSFHSPSLPLHHPVHPSKGADTLLLNLPKIQACNKSLPSTVHHHNTPTTMSLSIQNQPYRTAPLIQPSIKVELGPGSAQHLKRQTEHVLATTETTMNSTRSTDFAVLKHKPHQGLTKTYAPEYGWQSSQAGGGVPYHNPPPRQVSPALSPPVHHPLSSRQVYNNPIHLYSSENVADVARMNKMGMSGLPTSPSGLLHPNKVVLNPPKDYNPRDSATWQALQESDPKMTDPDKLKNFSTLREHDPIYSEIYTADKHKSASPQPRKGVPGGANSENDDPRGSPCPEKRSPEPSSMRSPVADLLPPGFGGKAEKSPEGSCDYRPLSSTSDGSRRSSIPSQPANVPLFETNTIGGRKRIAQCTSFNKLMMDVFGE